MHPACIGGKRCFYGCPRVTVNPCATDKVLPFIFDCQVNKDNIAVLVVSPLLLLMMDQVDGVQAETAGFRYRLERCHADDVASNLAHVI